MHIMTYCFYVWACTTQIYIQCYFSSFPPSVVAIEWSRESLFPPNDYCSPEARPSRFSPLHIAFLSGLSSHLPPNVSKVKGSWRLDSISSLNLENANNTSYSARVLMVWSLKITRMMWKIKIENCLEIGCRCCWAQYFFYYRIVSSSWF